MKQTIQASFVSGYMGVIGSLVLCFILFHLAHFTFHMVDPSYAHLVDTKGRHDVYTMMVSGFKNTPVSLGYIVAMIVLATHLWHGIPSFFQSLGIRHPFVTQIIEIAGPMLAVAIAAGFCAGYQ